MCKCGECELSNGIKLYYCKDADNYICKDCLTNLNWCEEECDYINECKTYAENNDTFEHAIKPKDLDEIKNIIEKHIY